MFNLKQKEGEMKDRKEIEPLLTRKEAARYLSLSPGTLAIKSIAILAQCADLNSQISKKQKLISQYNDELECPYLVKSE